MSGESAAWLAQHWQPELNKAEREFRDRFVTEYLLDYSPAQACIRLGFTKEFASEYSAKYMGCKYVASEIKRRESAEVATTGVDGNAEARKKQIMAQLFAQANYHGHGASHGARVAALKTLIDVYGMNAPTKSEIKVEATSNVRFYLPSNGRDGSAAAAPAPQQPQAAEVIEEATLSAVVAATLAFPTREDAQQ